VGERGGEGREVRAYTHNSFSETDFGDSVQCLFPRLNLASGPCKVEPCSGGVAVQVGPCPGGALPRWEYCPGGSTAQVGSCPSGGGGHPSLKTQSVNSQLQMRTVSLRKARLLEGKRGSQ